MELKEARLAKDLTQDDLSAISGYTQRYLSLLEKGTQVPSLTTYFDLCDSLGKSPDAFMRALVRRTKPKPPGKKSNV